MHPRLLILCSGYADELFRNVSRGHTGRWGSKDRHLLRRCAVMILVDPTPPNKAGVVAT